ncbi:MAG: 4-hydroxy-2-oxo-heptane-1,7-dioate aldolase [Candidatus Poribacteria bacterium]|nr:MAG: 4-hydroxy-2-oxo-heptane-1,7-dioate aldolase [Candidatus Poribacteria bacterium]
MRENIPLQKLRKGQPTVGSWLTLASPLAAEFLAHVGFDWLVVDTEHSPIGLETVCCCFQAIATTPTTPMARVADNDPTLIKQILDVGAMGIVVPMIMSAEEAQRAVDAAKYPPVGHRSVSGARCTLYGSDYRERANESLLVIAQIEHIEAVERAEAILSVPGVDAGFIGPNDLAWSMGAAPGSPEHEAAVQRVLEAGKRTGKPVGIHTYSGSEARRRIQEGFRFLAIGSDARFMQTFARQQLEELSPEP